MNRTFNILKPAISGIVGFCCFLSAFGKSGGSNNTFASPDFAFPKTVINNAESALRDAKKSGDDLQLIQAAIQLTIANQQVSVETMPEMAAMLDDLAASRSGVPASILRLIEARLYANVYDSDSYTYSRRILPTDSFPAQPTLWSKELFALKVNDLITQALADTPLLAATPVEPWKPLFSRFDNVNAPFYPNLYAVVSEIACRSLKKFASDEPVIPFTGSASNSSPASGCSATLTDIHANQLRLARQTADAGNPAWLTRVLPNSFDELAPYDTMAEQLLDAYTRYSASPYSVEFLLSVPTDKIMSEEAEKSITDSARRLKSLMAEAIEAHSDYVRINALKNKLNEMNRKSATLTVSDRVVPGMEFPIKVTKSPDSGALYVHIFKVTSKDDINKDIRTGAATFITAYEATGDTCKIAAAPLPPANYVAALSTSQSDSRKSLLDTYPAQFTCSAIQPYASIDRQNPDSSRLYLLDVRNGAPLSGVKVKFVYEQYHKPAASISATTGAEGWVKIPAAPKGYSTRNLSYTATLGSDSFSGNLYTPSPANDRASTNVAIFPSLSIYKPGDTCEFAIVTYKTGGRQNEVLPGTPVKVRLMNASAEEVDTLTLVTDAQGRASGQFAVPRGGMLGTFTLAASTKSDKFSFDGITNIQVEQYRRPGFFVELDKGREYYTLGEEITLSGHVTNYSGMPMAGSEVTISVSYIAPWWRYSYRKGNYAATVTTDEQGAFSLTLPTAYLRDTQYAQGAFMVRAEATSAAGETRQSEAVTFSLGNLEHISLRSPSRMMIEGDNIVFEVKAEGFPERPELSYTLTDAEGNTAVHGTFSTNALSIDAKSLPSGKYTLKVWAPGLDKANASQEYLLYRADDKRPPELTPLWIPETSITAVPGARTVRVPVGSSYRGQSILCIVSDDTKIISRRFIKATETMNAFEVPAPSKDNQIYVDFFTTHTDFISSPTPEVILNRVTVTPAPAMLKMETISFRDKLTAGGKERWVFRYTGTNTSASELPVIATLTDKALNTIVPFSWHWNTYVYRSSPNYIDAPGADLRHRFAYITRLIELKYPELLTPGLFTYGQSLYPYVHVREYKMMYASAAPEAGAMKVRGTAKATATNSAAMEVEEEAQADSAVAFDGGEAQQAPSQEQLRQSELPLAWFKPMLSTDADGTLDITFDVPDFNTTWQLQLLAYNKDLALSYSNLSTTASKPVMAQTSAPRFLRTGDQALLPATIYNNTDAPADVEAEIQLFDPLTGTTLLTRKFEPMRLEAKGSRVVSVEWDVPDSVEFVAFKVLARSGAYTDGEQSLVAILPSSSPVIESHPFYLSPSQEQYTMQIQRTTQGTEALTYCNNPVWYCVTALPTLTIDTDASVLSLANAMYGHSIALGLTRSDKQIERAISIWSESADSILVSALEHNPELKVVSLESTPWVNNAAAETLRMQQLKQLLDTDVSSSALDAIVDELVRRQSPGGGWSWCEGMEPSRFITGQVLWRLAMLRHMGYAPSSAKLQRAEYDAIDYVENSIQADFKKYKNMDAGSLLNWFYVRSFYSIPTPQGMRPIKEKALKAVLKSWHNYDIYETATAATLLWREGYKMQARELLQSLTQKATSSPERGMWFDNMRLGRQNLINVAQVLEAFVEISPESPCINSLRQWLLIERQAQDWGSHAQLVEVVWSILSSGTRWTEALAAPVVKLGDTTLVPSSIEALTGSFTMQLPADAASGATLSISRSGDSPAWGAVINQYVAPSADIRDFGTGDVSISKRLLRVVADEQGIRTENVDDSLLRTGDKVRVQLTVTSARDIDYAVITDEQAACLAPTDALSSYKFGEIGYYREVRSGVTNIFIPRLPKGRFLLEYDCFVEGEGKYSLGIATLQSLYTPSLSAHSAGTMLEVSR